MEQTNLFGEPVEDKEFFVMQLKQWAADNIIECLSLTNYQYRLVKTKNKIGILIICDIYPVNKRYHIIKHPQQEMVQQRGDVKELEIFLESVFNYE